MRVSVLKSIRKRVVATATAVVLIVGAGGGLAATAAYADDAAPDQPTTSVVTPGDASPSQESAPAPEAPAAAAPVAAAPAPVAVEAPVAAAPVVAPSEATSNVQTPAEQLTTDDAARTTGQGHAPPPPPVSKKVFVCKYVGTPGVNERLQTGQNPISVSVNSIKNWDGTIPGYFADAQGRSYTLAYDEGQAKPDVSACPTPVVVCKDAGSLTWTKDAHLTTMTVTLKKGFDSCDVSLNSYETEGATWETSGNQTFVDHATIHLTKENPTGTLTVKTQGCFQQHDGYIGTTRYDGKDGALPHYPNSSTPAGLIDHWNGAVDCTPPPLTPKVCTTIATGPTATNLDAKGWYQSDTRATGRVDYVNGGVRLHTTDAANPGSSQNKATLYRAITPTPLSEFGEPSVTFADGGTGVKPGMQVGIDVDGDGDWDGYLVGEPWSYGAHNWWVNKPGFNVPSGMGYTSFGSWADFVAANPKAKVIELGLSLGSGVLGDWTVTNLTAGCTSYTFNYVKPTTPVEGTPVITAVGPTCATPFNTITYNIPVGLSVNGFTGTGSIRAEDYPDARGDGSSIYGHWNVPVVVQDGFSYNGPTTLQFDLIDPATVNCATLPDKVTFTCDAYKIAGATLADKPFTITDSENGDTITLSDYESDKGGYYVEDTMTKAGVRTVQITFLPYVGVAPAPGEGDTYTLVDIEGRQFAQWTHTFTKCDDTTTPPTTTPTSHTSTPVTPASNGGANTGLNGSQPGTSTSFWTAGNSATFGIGLLVVIVALFGVGMMLVRRRNRNNGEAGVEAL